MISVMNKPFFPRALALFLIHWITLCSILLCRLALDLLWIPAFATILLLDHIPLLTHLRDSCSDVEIISLADDWDRLYKSDSV